jgi:hypothetical protein
MPSAQFDLGFQIRGSKTVVLSTTEQPAGKWADYGGSGAAGAACIGSYCPLPDQPLILLRTGSPLGDCLHNLHHWPDFGHNGHIQP